MTKKKAKKVVVPQKAQLDKRLSALSSHLAHRIAHAEKKLVSLEDEYRAHKHKEVTALAGELNTHRSHMRWRTNGMIVGMMSMCIAMLLMLTVMF